MQSAGTVATATILGLAAHLPNLVLQVALASITCFFLLVDGPRFLGWMTDKVPITADVQGQVGQSFQETAISVIWATLAAAEKATRETTVRCFNPYENGDGTLDVPTFLAVARERSALHRLYLTGFLSGLRLGELCGLQLDDDQWHVIDGKRARQLRVERQLGQDQRSLRAPAPTPTKTGKGRRLIDVADALGAVFDEIKAERKRLILERGWPRDTAWMFCTGNGTPYSEGNVERDFRRILRLTWPKKRAADPDPPQWNLSPHSMRHSFAVAHILGGCDAQWLKQQMGHSSIAVTLDVYGDWFQKQDEGRANRGAGRLLGDKVGDKRG